MVSDASPSPGPGAGAPPSPQAGRWTLQPERSKFAFSNQTAWGLVPVRGTFGSVSGQGEVGADGSARGTITIDAASVNTKNKRRDVHLRSDDFFKVAAHPAIIFTIGSAELGTDGSLAVAGELAVAGVTKPLSFAAQVAEQSASSVVLSAEVAIERVDFGLDWNKLGMIKGPARLTVTAAFERDAAS